MIRDDEAQLIRLDHQLSEYTSRSYIPDVSGGSPCLLARTKIINTYPATAQCYYGCEPLAVLGTEAEGKPGVVSGTSATFLALNLGSSIPPAGTQVVVTYVGNRWVFRYDA